MSVGGKLSAAFCVAAVFLLAVGVAAIVLVDQLNHILSGVNQFDFQMEQLAVASTELRVEPRPTPQHMSRLKDLNNMSRTDRERELIGAAAQLLTAGRTVESMQKLDELGAYYRAGSVAAHQRLVTIHHRAVIGAILAMMDSVVLLVCLMYLVRLWLIRPLQSLQAPATGIVSGEMPSSVAATGSSEFAGIAEALNKLIARVHDLEARAGKAERFAMVGEASSYVAHNLMQPLTSIRTLAEYERDLPKNDADVSSTLAHIIKTVDTLERWVRQMVSSTRPLEFRAARQQLEPVVHDSLAMLQPVITQQKIVVNFDSTDGLAEVSVDPVLFGQAVCALLSNAIDAAGEAGKIEINLLAADNGGVSLSIRDDGEGMTEEIKSKAFNPFFTTRQNRCGLGLTTVQRIVALHHGSVHIDSEPDKGTTVKIDLPAATAPQRPTY